MKRFAQDHGRGIAAVIGTRAAFLRRAFFWRGKDCAELLRQSVVKSGARRPVGSFRDVVDRTDVAVVIAGDEDAYGDAVELAAKFGHDAIAVRQFLIEDIPKGGAGRELRVDDIPAIRKLGVAAKAELRLGAGKKEKYCKGQNAIHCGGVEVISSSFQQPGARHFP